MALSPLQVLQDELQPYHSCPSLNELRLAAEINDLMLEVEQYLGAPATALSATSSHVWRHDASPVRQTRKGNVPPPAALI